MHGAARVARRRHAAGLVGRRSPA